MSSEKFIVAICGFEGSGKDTIAKILVDKYGFTKLSFASILKDVVALLFGWDRSLIEGDTIESREWREKVDEFWSTELGVSGFTPRLALQLIGTNLFRKHFNNNIWTIALKKKILCLDRVVITDCRFENEMLFLKSLDCKFSLIHVFRELHPSYLDYKNCLIDSIEGLHESSYSFSRFQFDFEIENKSTLEKLEHCVDSYVSMILN